MAVSQATADGRRGPRAALGGRLVATAEAVLADAEAACDATAPLVYAAGAAALVTPTTDGEGGRWLPVLARLAAVAVVSSPGLRAPQVLRTLVLPALLAAAARDAAAVPTNAWRTYWAATAHGVRAATLVSTNTDAAAAAAAAAAAGAEVLAAVVAFSPADRLLASPTSVRRVALSLLAAGMEWPALAPTLVHPTVIARMCSTRENGCMVLRWLRRLSRGGGGEQWSGRRRRSPTRRQRW
jgi:hypothetical protein